jgi:pimeloyl-ACP methyl ester carboxylesterase
MGGGISMMIAAQAPERIRKIVLAAPVGIGSDMSPALCLMSLPPIFPG